MKHTQKPPIDLLEIFPFLRGREKNTIRLHPRIPETELSLNQSKLGGRFLWSKEEPWPVSTVAETRPSHQSHSQNEIPLVSILQLRAEDFPEMQFPQGTNLFQLL